MSKDRPPLPQQMRSVRSNASGASTKATGTIPNGSKPTVSEPAPTDTPNASTNAVTESAPVHIPAITAAPTVTPVVPVAIVIACANPQQATLLGSGLRAWLLPSGQNIAVHIIISTPTEDTEAKIATLLLHLGYEADQAQLILPALSTGW